ncbi:hypothetical protein AAVH_23669 [Aphelenchoides avenae]|nr:hypothetical protein AAVH_23669 [Aphelenchus avenae]
MSDDDFFEVPNLVVDEESSSESDASQEPGAKKARGKALRYEVLHVFRDEVAFNRWWDVERNLWTYQATHTNKTEDVQTWFCKKNDRYSGKTGYKCLARLRIHIDMQSRAVTVKRCERPHDHSAPEKLPSLTDEQKARVKELSKQGLMPKQILIRLTTEQLNPLPDLKQIQWFVNRQRTPASAPFTDHQLRTYCENNTAVPEDPDKPFVLGYEVASTESFYVVWTTQRLLGRQEDKFLYNGVFRVLKASGYVPSEVLGDGAAAITNATKANFPLAKRIMCHVHVLRRADKHMAKIEAGMRKHMREEILALQHARNEVEFARLSALLLDVWKDEQNESVDEFSAYFEKEWITSDCRNWFEGATENCANNNGLESTNLRIKTDFLLRRMQAFVSFLEDVNKILNFWSVHLRPAPSRPTIPLKVMKEAYSLQRECEDKKRLYFRITGTNKYIFASSTSQITEKAELKEPNPF